MRHYYLRSLFFAPLFLLFQSLWSQTNHEVMMQGNGMRHPMQVPAGVNTIQLCGLEEGKTYTAIAVGVVQGQNATFKANMVDAVAEQQALGITNPGRPQQRTFTTQTDCAELKVDAIVAVPNPDGVPMVLSVVCNDCPDENTWFEKFKEKAERAVNISTVGGISAGSLITNTLIGGDCFEVSGISSSGNSASRGTFNNGSASINIQSGVVLCTGNVNVIPGPNNTTNANGGFNVNSPDDADLATVIAGNQFDVSRIEFDFVPTSDFVKFEFVFGSEEYCEYAGSQFNDVFGFFISGPGITGNQNIALVPGTTTPITINTVNHFTNTGYYINNNNFNPCQGQPVQAINFNQLDGWTVVLTALAEVEPCETYHIKLAIADISDSQWASAVFLQANSFNAGDQITATPIYPSGQNYVYEDCGDGFIRFVRTGDLSQSVTITYTISGNSTATPGADYEELTYTVTFGPGESVVQVPITVFADLLDEDDETIIIELENSCSCDDLEIEFIIRDKPPLEVELDDQILCGSTSTTLAPTATGGLAPLTYQWNTGATSSSINVNTPGTNTYTVTVTDACGTTSTAEATVTLSPSPTANLSGSGTFCTGQTGAIDLILTLTGEAPWEVVFNNDGTTETLSFSSSPAIISVNSGGNYSLVSVVSENGCTGTVTGNITINEITVNLNLTPNDPTCFGSNNGSINASASGGSGPFTYNWSPSGSGPNQTNLMPGSYSVTVTNGNGCTAEESVDLTEPLLLTADVVSSVNIDCNNPQGGADLEVSGGTPGYDFNWSNSSSQQNPTFNMGGTYTVTVTDDNNCTTTATVVITANTTPPTAIVLPPQQVTCAVPELTLDGTGSSNADPYTFEWGGPGFVCCDNTLTPVINQGGSYSLTVTNNDNGCTATATVNVAANNTPPNVNINTPANIGCTMPVLTLNGAGTSQGPGITTTWSTLDGNFVCCTNGLNPQIDQAGTYTLTVVNTITGCTAEESVTVTGNTDLPTALILPPAIVNCYSPEITLDGSGSSSGGNINYNWSGPPGGFVNGQNTSTPTIDLGGTYTLTVTDSGNNCTATATITVTANLTPPVANANNNAVLTCTTPTLNLIGIGSSTGSNMTYLWTTPNGNIVNGETTLMPTIDQPGTYTLLVTNLDNGCTDEDEVVITADQNTPVSNAGPDLMLNCTTPTVQLQGSGSTGTGFTFLWTVNPGNIQSGGNTYTPTVNQSGTYTLLVTNTNNGCTAETVVNVMENFDYPDAQIAPPGVLTCDVDELELNGSNSTQGSNINYNWSGPQGGFVNGQNTSNPTIDLPGTYSLTVTNSESGCTDVAQIVVTQNIALPIAQAGPNGQLNCTNPTFNLNGTGSSSGPLFFYEWTTNNGSITFGEFTLFPVVDQAGTYTLIVTNADNGCTATDNAVVTVDPNLPVANAGPDLELNCNNFTLQLLGSATGSGSLQYLWEPQPGNIVSGANTLTPIVDEEGYYLLTVTNPANGCTSEDVAFVSNNIVYPDAIIFDPQQLNCVFTTVEIDATASSEGSNFDYTWTTNGGSINSGGSTLTPEVDQPGTYTLVIENEDNFCTATASVVVTQDITPPLAVASAAGQITCQFPQLDLSGAGSSVGPEFFYLWTTANGNILSGELTLTPTVGQIGAYNINVTNADNGCETNAMVTVTSSQTFPTVSAGNPQDLTCTFTQLNLDGSGSSQGAQYAYTWYTQFGNIVFGGNTLSPLVNAPGTYDLTVINLSTGCTSTGSVDVGLNTALPTSVTAPGGILSCTVNSLILSGAGSSSGAGFTYTWTTTNGNIVSGGNTLSPVVNAVGNYTLVVNNTVNGCSSSSTTNVAADASLPVASAGTPQILDCNVSQFDLNGDASSQGAQYNYVWMGPGIVQGVNTLTPLINQPGLYELLVTNTGNGCTALSSVNIPQDIVLPVAEAGPASVLNCTFTNLSLNGAGTSTGPVFTYNWTTSNGNILNGDNTLSPLIDAPGTYTLLVSNTQNGCSIVDNVIVIEDVVLPQANAGNPGLITCTNATVTLNGSGSTGPIFTYLWTTPDGNIASPPNTLAPVVDAPGTYTLLVSNTQNGCTNSAVVVVDKDANVPTALALVGGELNCVTNQIQILDGGSTQGATMTYNWETTNGNIVSGGNTLTPVVNQPGQYTLNVFNTANNCLATSTVTVNLNLVPPVANAGAPAVISCLAPILTLNGGGSSQGPPYTYQWSTQNGNILTGGTTINPQIDQSGFYSIVVTDQSNGCTAGAQVQIILDQNTPESNPGASPTLTCAVTSLSLNGLTSSQGPLFTYLWMTTNGNIISGETTLTPTIDQPGTYTLLVSNFQNGCTSLDDVIVNQNITPPVASAGSAPTLTCATTSTPLNGTGSSGPGFSYLWTTLDGTITGGSTTTTPTVNDPGLYNLLVTNNQTGCTNTAQVNVFEDVVLPLAAAEVIGELTCSVTSLDLSGSGSSTGSTFGYLWTTNNGQISNGATTLLPTVTAPGIYQLVVTNASNGCTQTASVPVTQNTIVPQANAGANALLTCVVTSLTLTGTGSGGTNGVSYAWSGPGITSGGNTTNPVVEEVGVYTLTVTDLYNGCTKTDAAQVAEDVTNPIVAIAAPGELTCVVTVITIDAENSSKGSQFQYLWNGPGIVDGGTSLSPLVDQPGAYNLLITNILNGCTATASTPVDQTVAFPLAEAGNGFEITCSVEQSTLSAIGSSAGPNFSYVWSTSNGNILSGANAATPLVNAVGVYTLQVLNTATGCSATDVVAVTLNTNLPSAIELFTTLPACDNQRGEVVFEEIIGGEGPYLYSINNGASFLSANQFGGLTPGTYDLVVQDANGCEFAQLLQFPVPLEPEVTLPPIINLSFGSGQTITATLNIPLSEVDTIIWSPMDGLTLTSQPNVVLAQPFKNIQYTVTIINNAGCEDRAVILVRVDDPNLWAPNVISSINQDGLNDNFLIFAAPGVVREIKSLQVYDRWGNQLFLNENFQPNEENLGWNGSFRQQYMNPGVYVWWAEIELISGEKIIMKGDVTIVD